MEYIIKDKYHVDNRNVKIANSFNAFLRIQYKEPNKNPNGSCGIGKHYHLRMNPIIVTVYHLI